MAKRIFSVYFEDDLLGELDAIRGDMSRNQYICEMVAEGIARRKAAEATS